LSDLHRDRSSVESDRADLKVEKSTQIRKEFDRTIAAAEKLENAEEMLWEWLEAIGFRLGLRIEQPLC